MQAGQAQCLCAQQALKSAIRFEAFVPKEVCPRNLLQILFIKINLVLHWCLQFTYKVKSNAEG